MSGNQFAMRDLLVDRFLVLLQSFNQPGNNWLSLNKSDQASFKDILFNDLHSECRLAAPGARLSFSCRSKLERLSKEERRQLVSRLKEGCAPLFVSCKKGNIEIVEYLVEQCGAQVDQKGLYEQPDDRSRHHATPLWCAAVSGNLPIVQYLVRHGADVNSVSDTGSTPVRSACFMTHLEIVKFLVMSGADICKPNHNGGTCLINSVQSYPLCKFLLESGAQVNAQNIEQRTALHYAIHEHRLETTKLLLEYGADPMITSLHGDDALQTACLKVATPIFFHLIEHYPYSQERIADAYELLGTTFLDVHGDLQSALLYWRKGLEIRYYLLNQGLSNGRKKLAEPKAVYNYAIEFTTYEELDEIALDLDEIRIQSLLICERILGTTHKDMIFRLMCRVAAYSDSLQYQRCINLWIYALELRIAKDTVLHPEACFATQTLVRFFLDLQEKYAANLIEEAPRFTDVFIILQLIADQLPFAIEALSIRPLFKNQQDNFDRILKVLTHLLYVLYTIDKSESETEKMAKLTNRLIRINPRTSTGDSLLHLVVCKSNILKNNNFIEEQHSRIFPDANLVEFLIEAGAPVDAVNAGESTPLHLACLRVNFNPKVVDILLKNKAHIDRKSASGNHAQLLLSSNTESHIDTMKYISLKCLAARKISELGINVDTKSIPTELEEFIRIH